MPETTQPLPSQQMTAPNTNTNEASHALNEQPKPQEPMTMSLRGGGEGEDVCCGLCAGLACFECLNCCC
ncbi:hypothetical protein HO173_003420 [Letharia columbiana]|uniref:Cysteine-rich transmembrane CYSTM domain-containing protein n=1 Tax=Letharia columbiana TaxID=112416 RepID=A0A8H6G125_9LECA|nr:uncharacterized protein HO173_003420 [Letharia columbiana]KAF6238453.1 hypothetical protein HO173_003420 [Letharia columbiana]